MNSALAVYEVPTGDQLQAILTQAKMLVGANFLPDHLRGSVDKVAAVITLGNELGLGPWAAINNVFVIGGKPSINVNLMQALVQRSGQLEQLDFKEVSEKRCEVFIKRLDVDPGYTAVFTIEDANRANLTSGKNGHTWKAYPKYMLKARALSDGYRVLFSDVLMGLYTPEELGANVSYNEATDDLAVAPEEDRLITVAKESGATVTVVPKPEPEEEDDDAEIIEDSGIVLDHPNFEGISDPEAQKKAIVFWLKSMRYIMNDDELKLVSKKLADQGKTFKALGPEAFLNAMIETIFTEWPDRLESVDVPF